MQTANILYLLLIAQVVALLAVATDIFAARQFFGLVYLLFLPGFLLLKLLRLERVGFMKTTLFSVGLSLVFLMLSGLLLNVSLPILGISNPLSSFSIPVTVGTTVLIIYLLFVARREESSEYLLRDAKFSPITSLLICFPIGTVLGAELSGIYDNSFVLMILVVVVCLVVVGAFWERIIPAKIYSMAILAISFFLLFHISLVSNFLIGADVHTEYFFAQLTSTNSFWDRTIFHPYDSMLSVTILPTMLSKFLNLDMDLVFKLLYPLIYSLVPVSLYYVYHKQTGSHLIAFLSVFFFMSIDVFFVQMLGLARQMIAELFFALLILLMFEDRISPLKKRILFFVLSWALVVSHYSVAYLFGFLLLANLFLLDIYRSNGRSKKNSIQIVSNRYMVLGYLLIVFLWDLLFTKASYDSLASFVNYVIDHIVSYSPSGLNELTSSYLSPLHEVSRYVFYVPQILIVVGVAGLILERKKPQFNPEYSTMSIASLTILLMCIFLPSFAAGLNMTRFYHLSLFFLAPFPFVGILFILNSAKGIKPRFFNVKERIVRVRDVEKKRHMILLVTFVLILVFLFQVGFIYEIAHDVPTSISLSRRERINGWPYNMHTLYVEQSEVSAIEWLMIQGNHTLDVYADVTGSQYLTSYGFGSSRYLASYGLAYASTYRLKAIEPQMINETIHGSYVYLDELNVVATKVGTYTAGVLDTTDFSSTIDSADHIYSNGANDVYYWSR